MIHPVNYISTRQRIFHRRSNIYSSENATDEVEVLGALALVLFASRAGGVAPLRLTRARAGHRITVSSPIATVSRVVMMIFNTIMLTRLALDFLEEPTRRVRAGESTLKAVIWIGDMALVMLVANIAVLAGPGRMRDLIRVLKQLKQLAWNRSPEVFCACHRTISTVVDFSINGKPNGAESHTHAQATIRRLALSYERVSEVVRQLNAGNGAILLAMLTSICLRLVLTPYYLLLGLFDEDDVVTLVVVIQFCWSLFHINNLLLIVEPCHWTHEQRERTEILIGQLMVHLAPHCEAAGRDLERFAKQAQLSHASFMPLGIYTLARPLMVTILGGVTTYLVIIIQFQKISNLL